VKIEECRSDEAEKWRQKIRRVHRLRKVDRIGWGWKWDGVEETENGATLPTVNGTGTAGEALNQSGGRTKFFYCFVGVP
jgi:hypothetical protein